MENITFDFKFFRGRVAQAAILKALGIKRSDKVAIQAFTCLAVPEGVYATGAEPLYIDIEPDGFNMCSKSLEDRISTDTKAIIIQHTYGIPSKTSEILAIANRQDIPVIEDCCHILPDNSSTQLLGKHGAGSFYSLEWGKPLAVGLGGMAIVNDAVLKDKMENDYVKYSNPSLIKRLKIELQYYVFKLLYTPRWYWPIRSAFHTMSHFGIIEGNFQNPKEIINGSSDDFTKRMAFSVANRLAKRQRSLSRIKLVNHKIVNFYRNKIKSSEIIHPNQSQTRNILFSRYPLRVEHKEKMLSLAKKAKIELANWYSTPIHPIPIEHSHVLGYTPGSCPNAEKRVNEVVSLPTHCGVNDKFLNRVASFFNHLM